MYYYVRRTRVALGMDFVSADSTVCVEYSIVCVLYGRYIEFGRIYALFIPSLLFFPLLFPPCPVDHDQVCSFLPNLI